MKKAKCFIVILSLIMLLSSCHVQSSLECPESQPYVMNSYKITVARDDNSSPAELLERAKNENAEAVILNETQARSGDRHVFDEYLNDNTLIFFTKMTDREIAELYKIPFDFGGAAQDGDIRLGTALTMLDGRYHFIDSTVVFEQSGAVSAEAPDQDAVNRALNETIDIEQAVKHLHKATAGSRGEYTYPQFSHYVYTKAGHVIDKTGSLIAVQGYSLYIYNYPVTNINERMAHDYEAMGCAFYYPIDRVKCNQMTVGIRNTGKLEASYETDASQINGVDHRQMIEFSHTPYTNKWRFPMNPCKVSNNRGVYKADLGYVSDQGRDMMGSEWEVKYKNPKLGEHQLFMPGIEIASDLPESIGKVRMDVAVPVSFNIFGTPTSWSLVTGTYDNINLTVTQ